MKTPAAFQFTADFPVTCLVADGMGGHADGAVASMMAVEFLTRSFQEMVSESQITDALIGANFEIYAAMDHKTSGMGTTIAGIQLQGNTAAYFNVGDARIYSAFGNELKQISTDDKPQIVSSSNQRGMITQALGGGARYRAIYPHVSSCEMKVGQKFIICSDGVTDVVTDKELSQFLRHGFNIESLVHLVLQRGAPDNFSIVEIAISLPK